MFAASAGAAAAEDVVHIGMARSVSNGAELIAIEKGYFRDAGIKVEMEDIDTSANTLALLAQNRLQIVAGGISAGYFNGIEKNLPITIIADRVSTPIGHSLMLRPDLMDKVKSLADLKGKVVASNGAGSVSTYEVGKMLETKGLKIADVDVKIFPFTQMALAFSNKAIDAAIVIPPFVYQLLEGGYAKGFAEPDALRQADADDDRGRHDQHRLGEGQSRPRAALLHRLSARRARLLRRLSRRADQERDHRSPDPPRLRAAAGAAAQLSVAGAQPERTDQHREHARHAGLVREQRLFAGEIPGRTSRRCDTMPRTRCRSSGRTSRPIPIQARRLPVTSWDAPGAGEGAA